MEPIVERAAGIDVAQASVMVTVLRGAPHARAVKETRMFRTLTRDLVALREWLLSCGVTHVGMESTGVYWKPVYAVLEGHFDLIVGNAQHIKNVPGRKTDVKDSEWLAQLVRMGLIRKSFVPRPPIRELRDLTRYRRKLIETRTNERNRLLKLLETANIKLSSVASDVFGVSGMLMLRALIEGTAAPAEVAQLAKGKLRRKMTDLIGALEGYLAPHHRFILRLQVHRLDLLDHDLATLEAEITSKLVPYQLECALLRQIPGVDGIIAAAILAELGADMTVFHGPRHAAAWAGVCPGNNESGGKRRREKVRRGNVHLKTALVQAAAGASRKKGSYLRDKYFRLLARRGPHRASLAIAHKILIAAYHVLRDRRPYQDLGDRYLDQLKASRTKKNLVQRLERLGYRVTVVPA
jgi:transposase